MTVPVCKSFIKRIHTNRNSLEFGGKFGLIRCGFSVSLCEFTTHTFATLMWRADVWWIVGGGMV